MKRFLRDIIVGYLGNIILTRQPLSVAVFATKLKTV